MSSKAIRIGCASGFWGDSMIATPQLLEGGGLDYLVYDYLAEITMSIMAKARAKNPDHGYALDFVTLTMQESLSEIARQRVKVISNAGGVNPTACARALTELIQGAGLNLKVATVTGDDLMDRVEAFRARGITEMFSGEPMPGQFMSMNAYLGAFPIAEALNRGADIVITGRGVDSAVTVGACIHEFGWSPKDYDMLAAASLAGHIIECGAQATGGLFTDWRETEGWDNMGYPIVEMLGDATFTVTKPEGSGGLVSTATVAEQIVYEIGDPQAYILPDVVCDFSEARLEQAGENRVRVRGAKGAPPTDTLKVSATYLDGYRLGCYVTIGGIEAKDKAEKTAAAVLKRVRRILASKGLPDLTETSVEVLGAEAGYGPHARVEAPREVLLKIAVKHPMAVALNLFLRELTSSGTSMSPGTTGMGGHRPRPTPVVRLFSFLIDRGEVAPTVHLDGEAIPIPVSPGTPFDPSAIQRPRVPEAPESDEPSVEVPLIKLAFARSGDKGNDANIGVIARDPAYLPWIRAALTEEVVAEYFAHLIEGGVDRFDLPGIHALNFVLHEALAGGGIASLRNDPQGKTFAQMLLDIPVIVPAGRARELGHADA